MAMTFTTGILDAASFLGLGHVFTANMTGNIVFLGFALGGATGLSAPRSFMALAAFLLGALAGGRWMLRGATKGRIVPAIAAEAGLLAAAAVESAGVPGPIKIYGVIAATALAMGLRNAVVRKIAIPDMTTTVLTLTVTGIAADSSLAGGDNPRWRRRVGAVGAMLMGAAVGAAMVERSLTATLAVCAGIAAACVLAHLRFESNRRQ
jgi:uncharacterized membrane protein YoaK (UPF0700 family)